MTIRISFQEFTILMFFIQEYTMFYHANNTQFNVLFSNIQYCNLCFNMFNQDCTNSLLCFKKIQFK